MRCLTHSSFTNGMLTFHAQYSPSASVVAFNGSNSGTFGSYGNGSMFYFTGAAPTTRIGTGMIFTVAMVLGVLVL